MVQPPHEALTAVLIRAMRPGDASAIERLVERDSKTLPVDELLVAEVEGELRAAVALRSGETIADPFHPTAETVRLLELHRRQLRQRAPQRKVRGRFGRLAPALARISQTRR
jgi:hypothetical protein